MKQSMIYMQTLAVQIGLPLSKVERAMACVLDATDMVAKDATGTWLPFRNGQLDMLEALGGEYKTIVGAVEALIIERKEDGHA